MKWGGKWVDRGGGRITTATFRRIRAFIADPPHALSLRADVLVAPREAARTAPKVAPALDAEPARGFRFFDNRQKYLLFVSTCSEKWVVANRVTMELANLHPRPPALRVFDAGVGGRPGRRCVSAGRLWRSSGRRSAHASPAPRAFDSPARRLLGSSAFRIRATASRPGAAPTGGIGHA